jgi:hypothetical protein
MITQPVDMLDQLDQCRRRTGRLVGDNVYVSASPTAKAAPIYTLAIRFEIIPHAPKIGFVPPKGVFGTRSNGRIAQTVALESKGTRSPVPDTRALGEPASSLCAGSDAPFPEREFSPFPAPEFSKNQCRKPGSALILRTNASALSFHPRPPQKFQILRPQYFPDTVQN